MKINRFQQLSESYCGPAALQMLLDAIGISIEQEDVVRALQLEDRIEDQGMRPDQLGQACVLLAPDTQFWYKYEADLADIEYVLSSGFAIGVEWQGLFFEDEEAEREEFGDADNPEAGHYSVITFYDKEEQHLILVDPYKDFAAQSRIFDVKTFLRRWWDSNEVRDPKTGRRQIVTDEHLMFFITQADVQLDQEHGFKVYKGSSNQS